MEKVEITFQLQTLNYLKLCYILLTEVLKKNKNKT